MGQVLLYPLQLESSMMLAGATWNEFLLMQICTRSLLLSRLPPLNDTPSPDQFGVLRAESNLVLVREKSEKL
jgi:hypothetical protein